MTGAVVPERALAERLAEAEAIIAALLSAQIDAVVDRESSTPVLLSAAQEALRISERLYRSTFDEAPVGIVVVGLDGNWLRVNQRLCSLLRSTRSELLGPAAQNRLHAQLAPGEQSAFERMVAGRLDHHVVEEKSFERGDGGVMWARVNMSLHRGADGRPENIMLAIEDTTVSRLLEARAQRYLDSATVILVALDLTGRITLVNRFACSVLGWEPEELLGRSWIETCLPERIRGDFGSKYAGILAGGHSVLENPVITRSGEERLIEWRNTLNRDETGQATGVFSSGIDVTDRQQALDELQKAEERMRFVLESANVGIWEMDYASGMVRWSEVTEAHYGLAPGAFGGSFEAFTALIHPRDRASTLEIIAKATKSSSDFSFQHRALWPDGTVRRLSGRGRIHSGADGKPERGVGVSIDVTERHTLEEQYQQAQKMEAVGRLAGGVAHDFNNLLMVITGYSDLLMQGLIPADPRRADIEQIRKAADGAAALTRQLLAFSRQQVIEPRDVVLEDAVAASTRMLQRLIGEDVDVVTSLNAPNAMVSIDPGQLEQVIMNLALNARDAMPTGGKLTMETGLVTLTPEDTATHWPFVAGRFVMLAVSDTGVGMDGRTRAKIFEPFFTTKEQGKGTGLGLATVYGIVTQSNGHVSAFSEPGQGATFKVYLPMSQRMGTGSGEHRAVEAPAPRGVETVVLVEDFDGVRDIARRVLEEQGYKVIAASGPAAALDIARTFDGRIHLLLTDIVMPEMSGRVLAETFLEHRPGCKLLYMSGYTDDAVVRHGVLKAETPYLQKPFSPRALAVRVRQVLDARAETVGQRLN